MKKSNLLTLFLMATTATGFSLTSCQPRFTPQDEFTETVVFDTLNYEKSDSTFSRLGQASFTANIIYPVKGSKYLCRNIKEWTNEQLGGYYSYNLDTLGQVIEYYADLLIKNALEEIDEYAERHVSYTYDYMIQPIYESPACVSYQLENYNYTGGAHGGRYVTFATFRKDDGRIFGWDMIKHDSIFAVREMIKEHIKSYFNATTDEDLKQCLLLDNANLYTFPLPVAPPVLTAEGLQVIYQQYEIAPYVAGNPTCTIPYAEILPSMTITAQELLGTTQDDKGE